MFLERLAPRRLNVRRNHRLASKRSNRETRREGPAEQGHSKGSWRPQITRLESRIALNASAELNPLGQLVILGTAQDDYVEIDKISNDGLILRDGAGGIIPIANHPRGIGFESTAISFDEITASRIRIDLGAGDDTVKLGPLDGLDILVVGSPGDDVAELELSAGNALDSGSLRIDSDRIHLSSPNGRMDLGGITTRLIGDVTTSGTSQDRLFVDERLTIQGSLTLGDSLEIRGDGRIDLSNADLSSFIDGNSLRIHQSDASVLLGNASNSGGAFVEDLVVRSASTVVAAGSHIELDGDLRINDVGQSIRIDSNIQANSVSLSAANQLQLRQAVSGLDSIELRANQINVDGTLTTSLNTPAGQIRIDSGSDVELEHSLVTNRLTGFVNGTLVTVDAANQIRVVSDLETVGDLSLFNAVGDLRLESVVIGGAGAQITSAGMLGLCGVNAVAGSLALQGEVIVGQGIACDGGASGDVIADVRARWLSLNAESGIGSTVPIEVAVDQSLTAISQSGDIRLTAVPFDPTSLQPITIEMLTTRDGTIAVVAMQTLVVESATITSNIGSASNHFLDLTALGRSSDLKVGSLQVSEGFDVRLTAGDDVLGTEVLHGVNVVADDLKVLAGNGSADQDISIDLTTNVNDFEASVDGDLRGDLRIRELDSIRLATSDNRGDGELSTGNGQIIIVAQDSISVLDLDERSDADRKGDPELDANGLDNGRIVLVAPNVELGDGVQLHADKQVLSLSNAIDQPDLREPDFTGDENSIRIQTDRLIVGQNVELFTGPNQGTARLFAPRPDAESLADQPGSSPAFFDPNSISVNVLTQALQNDATGILTFDIGADGERGLTATIDWGDSDARRFQQIDGLRADTPYFVGFNLSADRPSDPVVEGVSLTRTGKAALQIEHLYLQEDVLDSTSNGRESATDPFSVRFSVRHHESIVVSTLSGESASVIQSGTTGIIENEVRGGVFSSTDHPTTGTESMPFLESGRASFIIPSLTIPVAFIPVRDVIPEIESLELQVPSETRVDSTNARIEQVGNSIVSSTSVEDFFRLRVRSPDPMGEDLIEPRKVPAELMQGDRLQGFLRSLPDASYEIEYVIANGSERSILRFDVRSGEPIIREGGLDEGVLKLMDLDDLKEGGLEERGLEKAGLDHEGVREDVDGMGDRNGKPPREHDDQSSHPRSLRSRFSKASQFARLHHGES